MIKPPSGKGGTSTLGDYARTLRDEPYNYVFKHKVYVSRDKVSADEVMAWARKRYAEEKKGHRYRIKFYQSSDGQRYVDCVYLETFGATDQVMFKLQWGYSLVQVQRGDRIKRRRLTPQQRKDLDNKIEQITLEYYKTLGMA